MLVSQNTVGLRATLIDIFFPQKEKNVQMGRCRRDTA